MSAPSPEAPGREPPNVPPSAPPPVLPRVPPKVAPEPLALRAPPRPVVRLSRTAIALATGVVAAAVLIAAWWSLQPSRRERKPSVELYNVDRVSRADGVEQLPPDYAKLKAERAPAPKLGEPLPGDLGPAILRAERQMAGAGGAPGEIHGDDAARAERLMQLREAQEASRSAVFFGRSKAVQSTGQDDRVDRGRGAADQEGPIPGSGADLRAPAASDPTTVQNQQDRKQAFLGAPADASARNASSLQPPASPYTVMAGTLIPAALLSGINSDLPGQVIAHVTEAVYDSATGRHLLIPQGTRLIGRYDSQVAFGQRRLLLLWTRMILPDTSSIALDRLPGIDPAGYAGLEDGVDWHWDRVLSGAALSTLLGVGAELAVADRTSSTSNASASDRAAATAGDGVQNTANQVGQELTRRNASIQPTLTIRPGFPMRVMVHKDLVLRPYQPLFFQRGATP